MVGIGIMNCDIELVVNQNKVTVISVKIINQKQLNTVILIDLKSRRDSDKGRIFKIYDIGGGPRNVNSKIIYYTFRSNTQFNGI